jgi:hypothetical protein
MNKNNLHATISAQPGWCIASFVEAAPGSNHRTVSFLMKAMLVPSVTMMHQHWSCCDADTIGSVKRTKRRRPHEQTKG